MGRMTCAQASQWLLEHDHYLILTHVRPDGDTVGSAAGLCIALRQQGKTAHILPDPNTSGLFLPYLEGLLAPEEYVPQTVVAVDIAARSMFHAAALPYIDRVDLTVDHHPSQEFYAAHTCLEDSRASCGEVIYDIVRHWGAISREAALPLYVALSTDCGCFVYNNTNAACHRVAAELLETGIDVYPINRKHFRTKSYKRLKLESMLTEGMELYDNGAIAVVTLTLDMMAQLDATEEDVDNISAFVGQIEGVRTGVTVRQLTPERCKVSLRTDPGDLNASHVCALLGGGGHAAASGASFNGSPEQTKSAILAAIRQVQAGRLQPEE